jgi:NADH-quinone oxidoreductase subunit A
MQYAFLPILLLIFCSMGLALSLLIVSGLFNPGRPSRTARMPYESGMDPIHDTRRRFDVRFHLLAIAFLIFDVELLFLYPWAVAVGGGGRGTGDGGEVVSGQWSVVSKSSIINLQSPIPNPSPAPRPSSPVPHLVFGGAMTFLLLLTLGFVYDWRKGIFRWR